MKLIFLHIYSVEYPYLISFAITYWLIQDMANISSTPIILPHAKIFR